MNKEELIEKVKNIKTWKNRAERAPHKPLLILYALGQVQQEEKKAYLFSEVELELEKLLIDFGPPRKSNHPEQPFARLQNDGFWQLNKTVNLTSFSKATLRKERVEGGFTDEVYTLLKNDPSLVQEIAYLLINEHFPETFHQDILDATGLDFTIMKRKKRDSKFRDKILRAYSYSCAVCGFNVRLGQALVGIEAAHIKWHQAGGPDIEENGIALCSLHHKLFDRGVFTLNESRLLIVSEAAHGTSGFDEWLMTYHGKPIKEPINYTYMPKTDFVQWHVKEVFKGPERYIL